MHFANRLAIMFKIIGGDGQEYGPVTAEQLRGWIVENRANGETKVRPEGGGDWIPLSALPEFADALAAGIPAEAPPQAPTEDAPVWTPAYDEAFTPPSESLDVGECLGHGWQLLTSHSLLIVGATSIVWALLTASSFTCLGGIISMVMGGALYGGLALLILRLIRGQPASVGVVFSCFGAGFVQLMLINIVTHFLSGIGMLFCLLPGIYLKVIWVFSLGLAADRGMAFWPAMELSRRVVSAQFFRVAALMAVAYLPVIIFTIYSSQQISSYMLATFGDSLATFKWDTLKEHLDDLARFAARLELQQQLLLLLNLPFAYAAVFYAYEKLFGAKRRKAD